MSFPLITASRLGLAEACPGSHALPWTRTVSEAASTGTAAHAFLERALSGDVAGALEVAPEELRDRLESIDLRKLASLFGSAPVLEETYAYHPGRDVARVLGASLGRDYSGAAEGEIVGTLDARSVVTSSEFEDVGVVVDWKTGRSFVPHPRENWQIKFAAISLARAFDIELVRGVVVKIDEDGAAMILREDWDSMQLDGIASDILAICETVLTAREDVAAGGRPTLVVGGHCTYCPARWSCPAQAEASQALVAIYERGEVLTPERAGYAWTLMKAIEGALEQMKERLRAFAEEQPIPLPNGKVVKPIVSQIEVLDLEAAFREADKHELPVAAVLKAGSVTKAGLERHLGKDEAKRLIELMRKTGGVGHAPRVAMREVKP